MPESSKGQDNAEISADAGFNSRLWRPSVDRMRALVREVYQLPQGGAGCCLHIVLDDYNTDLDSVLFCLNWAQDRGHLLCARVARLMMAMTKTQRRELCKSAGYS